MIVFLYWAVFIGSLGHCAEDRIVTANARSVFIVVLLRVTNFIELGLGGEGRGGVKGGEGRGGEGSRAVRRGEQSGEGRGGRKEGEDCNGSCICYERG